MDFWKHVAQVEASRQGSGAKEKATPDGVAFAVSEVRSRWQMREALPGYSRLLGLQDACGVGLGTTADLQLVDALGQTVEVQALLEGLGSLQAQDL